MESITISRPARVVTFRVSQIVEKYIFDLCQTGGENVSKMINRIIIEAHSKLDQEDELNTSKPTIFRR